MRLRIRRDRSGQATRGVQPGSFAAALVRTQHVSTAVTLRRRLLPATAAVLLVGAWLPWLGQQVGLYGPDFGLVAFIAVTSVGLLVLVWQAARMLERSEGRRRELEALYQRLVEHLPLVIYVDELTDTSSNIYTSPQVEPLLGYTVDEWVSDPDLFVKALHPDDVERVLAEVHRTNAENEPFACEYRLVTKDGRVIWIHDYSTVFQEHGEAVHRQGYLFDISRRKLAEEELRVLASSDALTLLANRTQLIERLRDDGDAPRSLLFLDLDDFKTINDSLGHRAGDGVLVELAQRICSGLRDGDLVARVGGDEFAVLTPVTDQATLESLARRLLDAIGEPLVLDGRELRPSASIGIATGGGEEEMLRNADLAMYAAKHRGGNGLAFFAPEMHTAAERRLALLADLGRPALFDELILHYQPTFDLRDGMIEGVEALLRWQHPRHGLLAPGTFVAAAEESGAIVGIGRWVLRTACREAAGWAMLADSPPVVAVNVSGRQLREPSFIEDVRAALFESGLPAPALRIELTESVLIHANETARDNLANMAELGVELAIDDFGTAHSWIGNLQQLAPDVLKIDRSFMVGIEHEDSPLLRAILALARELGLKVIAEGIETEDQLKMVRRLHCHAGQGFHLSRPVPAEDVTALLRHEVRVPGVGLRAV